MNVLMKIFALFLLFGVVCGLCFFIHDQSKTIDVLEDEISHSKTILEEQEQTLTLFKKSLSEKDIKLSEYESTVSNLKNELKEKDKEIEQLKERIDSFITVEATAYTAFCNTGCTGITATGYNVKNKVKKDGRRIIAVDPSLIPLGSKVKVHTPDKTFKAVALDTGGDIQGNRIDILMKTKTKAKNFGRKEVVIEYE